MSDSLLDLLLARLDERGEALMGLSVTALVDQVLAALDAQAPLTEKAAWLVATARLLELRSRLLLPAKSAEHDRAVEEAETWRARAASLAEARSLAAWLAARPQLGQETFPRGAQAAPAARDGGAHDLVEFLWASIAVFEGFATVPGPAYHPPVEALHGVAEARARILERIALAPEALPLQALLPEQPGLGLRRRSAWGSTFAAGLELAKQGAVWFEQSGDEPAPRLRALGIDSSGRGHADEAGGMTGHALEGAAEGSLGGIAEAMSHSIDR